MSVCGCDPPRPRCRECQRAGLVPFPPDMPPPLAWTAPPGSPAARGEFPSPVKPRLSIRELAARRRH
jgi:hypothetical protein